MNRDQDILMTMRIRGMPAIDIEYTAKRFAAQPPCGADGAVPAEWCAIVGELAEELRCSVEAEYPIKTRHYPSNMRRYELDMELVNRARSLLASQPAAPVAPQFERVPLNTTGAHLGYDKHGNTVAIAPVAQAVTECRYISSAGKVCRKCGTVHDGSNKFMTVESLAGAAQQPNGGG